MAARLLLAMALVVLVGGLTAWLVAGVVGPAVFHQHMLDAGVDDADAAVLHAEEAFRSAGALALGIALGAAALTSLAVSLLLTRRIDTSLGELSGAASLVAGGRFDHHVEAPGLGAEFDDLAAAFNDMAGHLAESEALRRRLLADVAHELRTPVATLTAYLEGLEDGVETLSPETVDVLRLQGTRLTRLADDLAAVTRAESRELGLELDALRPADLVAPAARSMGAQAVTHGVELLLEVAADLPDVLVDRDRIIQVLTNLLDNALRHTPAGGTVTIRAAQTSGGAVRLSVHDTGEGIDATHLPHVFERFYRADTARDRDHGGSGIGLAIAKALVEAHGGTMAASSDGPGLGATFTVELPGSSPHRSGPP